MVNFEGRFDGCGKLGMHGHILVTVALKSILSGLNSPMIHLLELGLH